ncbi:MAG: hypothetical protein WD267_14190 [Balneolales bacterium]
MKGYGMVWYILGTIIAWKAGNSDRIRRSGLNTVATALGSNGINSDISGIPPSSMQIMEKTVRSIAELNTRVSSKIDLPQLLLEIEARKN